VSTELTDENRATIVDLCRLHIEDAEEPPQTGVALDEQSLEALEEIRKRCLARSVEGGIH